MIYHGINQWYKNVFRLFWGCTAYLEEHAADSCWWIKWVLCPTFYFDNQVNMCILFTTKNCSYHGCLLFVESWAHCFDLWGNIWIGMNHSFTEPGNQFHPHLRMIVSGDNPLWGRWFFTHQISHGHKKGESIHWAAQNQLGLSENCVLKNIRVLLHVFVLKLPKNWCIRAFGQTQGWLIVCSQGLCHMQPESPNGWTDGSGAEPLPLFPNLTGWWFTFVCVVDGLPWFVVA